MEGLEKVQLKYMEAKDIIEKVSQAEADRRYPIEYIETLSEFIKICEDMGVPQTIKQNN